MGLKTSFAIALAAGAATYGVQETKQQTFDVCTSADTGLVQVVNPNRYFGRNNLYIRATGADGQPHQYEFDGYDPTGGRALDEARALCHNNGKPSANLRPRR